LKDSPEGIIVCLQCFNGGCLSPSRAHAHLHYARTHHPLGLSIKRHRKEVKKRRDDEGEEPPMKRLAIVVPSDEDVWDVEVGLRCFGCDERGAVIQSDDPKVCLVLLQVCIYADGAL
jgi:ubiquitin carboxyl-terminal hydrolase 5/13